MRYLSLFSGIEAATVAWRPLGWKCAAVAEIEPFPCAVLAHHYPDVPNLSDVTKLTREAIEALGQIDLVVFGSPCQDLSIVGHRKGLIDATGTVTRSGLFFAAINIFHWSGARFALWENVPGAFSSSKGRDFASVVEFMAGLDDVAVPANGWGTEGAAIGDNGLLEWAVLDAQWFGVAQRRRRVFALLDTGDWVGRPPILLEPESLRGNSAPRREAGAGATARTLCGSGGGIDREDRHTLIQVAFGGNNTSGPIECSTALRAKGGTGHGDFESETFCVTGTVTHALCAEGFDGSEDGTGRGTPVIAFNSNAQADQLPRDGGDYALNSGLTCSQQAAVAYSTKLHNTSSNQSGKLFKEYTVGLDVNSPPPVLLSVMQVRRLTPTECERLMGQEDGYTMVPNRGKPAADGPRYKALGNSFAVPVIDWIGRKIESALATLDAQ